MNRLVVATLAAVLTTATALAQTPPYPPVPPPQTEVIPVAPNERVVWQPGHWRWNGTTYVWIAGRYIAKPVHAAHWIEGHWAMRGGGWVWVGGHWG